MNQEELAVVKRQRVTRTLPFTTDICGRSGGNADDGADHMSVDEDIYSDAHNIQSLQDVRVSNNQVIHFFRISLNCTHYFRFHMLETHKVNLS
jgi:hypothetical protein